MAPKTTELLSALLLLAGCGASTAPVDTAGAEAAALEARGPAPVKPGAPADGPCTRTFGDDLVLRTVATGLSKPVGIAAPAGDPRVFVVEQGGRVRVLKDGKLLEQPFLDIRDRVKSDGMEQGLLGLAFHPDYATNGRFFVHYSDKRGGDGVLAEYRVRADDADRAEREERRLLVVEQPWANHNGGSIAFSPRDGFLYWGLGDGGAANDPKGSGQDLGSLLGKILRLDVDGGEPYGLPPGNPFLGVDGARAEIWAYGLRNPWRFHFDRETGDLWIGDVGQNLWEEIDFQHGPSKGGQNYGWNVTEGAHVFVDGPLGSDPDKATAGPEVDDDDSAADRLLASLTPPIYEYARTGGCDSVTGGLVYRGKCIPDLVGTYLFADWCDDWVRGFRQEGGKAVGERDWSAHLDPDGTLLQGISSFGEDQDGELYLASHRTGRVFRLEARPAGPGASVNAP